MQIMQLGEFKYNKSVKIVETQSSLAGRHVLSCDVMFVQLCTKATLMNILFLFYRALVNALFPLVSLSIYSTTFSLIALTICLFDMQRCGCF